MMEIMWQADLHAVAKSIAECLGIHSNTDLVGGQALDQP